MFGLNWFKRRPIIRVVLASEVSLDDLADRVHQRLRGVKESDDPLRTMLEIAAEEAGMEADMAELRLTLAIRERIHALPSRQRATLLDHVDGKLTYKQIARKRGMTERIVLRDLCRAYATLRMQMRSDDGRGDVSGPVGTAAAGMRDSTHDVGKHSGVHRGGEAHGGVPGSTAVERLVASGEKGG